MTAFLTDYQPIKHKNMKKEFFRAFMEASVDSAFEEFKEQALNLKDGEMSCEGMEILKLSFKAGFVSACKLLTKPQPPKE